MRSPLFKWLAGKAPPRPSRSHIFWSWLGAATSIALIALITDVSGHPLLMAPLGASAVLAFAVPDSPLAQPRNIVGGHIITTFVGMVFLALLGNAWWVAGLAVATAIAAMQYSRSVHPPAGANPLIVLATCAPWDYVLVPVALSAISLTLCAYIFNNIAPKRGYPTFWF